VVSNRRAIRESGLFVVCADCSVRMAQLPAITASSGPSSPWTRGGSQSATPTPSFVRCA